MSVATPQNINSTFVVIDDANNAIPIAVGDRFYKKEMSESIWHESFPGSR